MLLHQCLERFSTIEKPFYLWDAQADMVSVSTCAPQVTQARAAEYSQVHEDIDNEGILMHAVDTLPAELPVEATMVWTILE